MEYEKDLKVVKDGVEVVYTYYVRKKYSGEFECDMYNVGIKTNMAKKEIDDFSNKLDEAVRLCEYLYKENVSMDNLFLVAEEFIVTL